MRLFRITQANMKKKKSMVIALFFLMVLSGVFLNSGLKIMTQVGTLYEAKSQELNSADAVIYMNSRAYKPDYFNFFKNDNRVKEVEVEDIAFMSQAKMHYKGGFMDMGTMISNISYANKLGIIHIIDKADVPEKEAIYIPIAMKNYGFEANSKFEITYQGIVYSFKVAGFYESTYFGVSNYGCFRYFVNKETFQEMREKVGGGKFLSIQLNDKEECNAIIDDFYNQTDIRKVKSDASNIVQINPNSIIETVCMTGPNMFGGFTIAFSILMLIILLIVIRFRIIDTIQDNMLNNGALQAMGYTSKEVMRTIIMEFVSIAFGAAIVSILFSYLIMSNVCGMVTGASNLIWNAEFLPLIDIIGIVIMVGAVFLMASIASRRINKYPPVVALRSGSTTHSFKKNYFPLKKWTANLNEILSLKSFMISFKSNIMISVIISFLTFMCCFVMVMYINIGMDASFLYQMMGREISDVQISVTNQTDLEQGLTQIKEMPHVRKAYYSDQTSVNVNGQETLVTVAEDCSQFELLNVYEGKLPYYENEIVLYGALAKQIDKQIGDTVIAEYDGIQREYYVCGLAQSMSGLGQEGIMTLSGIQRINPTFLMRTVYVYVDESISGEEFEHWIYDNYQVADRGSASSISSENLNEKYARVKAKADAKIAKLLSDYGVDTIEYSLMIDGENVLSGGSSGIFIKKVTNLKAWGDGQLKSYASMLTAMCVVFVSAALGIIILVLSLVIKSMIRKRRQEFGTYKAIGFTTNLLIKQVGLNFLVIAIIGTTFGAILSLLFSNRILGAIFEQVGVINPIFGDFPIVIVLIALVISVFTYVTSMVMARKIRNISVYQLLSE